MGLHSVDWMDQAGSGTEGSTIRGIRKYTSAVAAAATMISGASSRLKACSYRAEPIVSATGLVRLTIDIMPAKAKPSAPCGQDSAASDMVAIMAIMLVMPLSTQITMAEAGLLKARHAKVLMTPPTMLR